MNANNSNNNDFTPQAGVIEYINNIFSDLYNIQRYLFRVCSGRDKIFSRNINKIIY